MKQIFLFVHLFLFFHFHIDGQNLVPNPSFEEYVNGCPENLNELPIGWHHYRESPNSFNTCVQPENLSDSLGWAPLNGFGYQEPADGESYVGLYTFGGPPFKGYDYREFIGTELLEPLEVGTEYYFSMKISPTVDGFYYFYMQTYSNNVGMQLSMDSYDWVDNPMPINNFAHLYVEDVLTDTVNWFTLEGSVIADQPYSHIVLGNFFLNSLTDTVENSEIGTLGAYYFIDQVCLSKNADCLVSMLSREIDTKIEFYPNPTKSTCRSVCDKQILNVELYSICGQQVSFSWNWAHDEISFDLSNLSPGIYHCILHFERGVRTAKIVVD